MPQALDMDLSIVGRGKSFLSALGLPPSNESLAAAAAFAELLAYESMDEFEDPARPTENAAENRARVRRNLIESGNDSGAAARGRGPGHCLERLGPEVGPPALEATRCLWAGEAVWTQALCSPLACWNLVSEGEPWDAACAAA